MNTKQALESVIDLASRWLENAEEGLTTRISPEMLVNEELWAQVLSEQEDDYARDDAIAVRDGMLAIERLNAVLKQRGCEHFDSAGDGSLTDLIDIVIDG